MTRHAAVQMVKRYAQQAGLSDICCHTFCGIGITIALENGSTLEEAQRLANHNTDLFFGNWLDQTPFKRRGKSPSRHEKDRAIYLPYPVPIGTSGN